MSAAAESTAISDVLGQPVENHRSWRSAELADIDDLATRFCSAELEDLAAVVPAFAALRKGIRGSVSVIVGP